MITLLSITGCILAMICSWLVSQGTLKPVYILGIMTSLCFIAINTMLAIGGEPGVLFLIVPSAWAIVASVIGLRRLRAVEINEEIFSDKGAECED